MTEPMPGPSSQMKSMKSTKHPVKIQWVKTDPSAPGITIFSVVSNANFSSIERVRALVFEYFQAQTSPIIRYFRTSSETNIEY